MASPAGGAFSSGTVFATRAPIVSYGVSTREFSNSPEK